MGTRIGSITFNGLASGFPTEEIITQVLELESRPIQLLQNQRESTNEKLAIFQDLNSKTRALRDLLRSIDNMNLVGSGESAREEFLRYTASSSDEDIARATAEPGVVGSSFTLTVDALARQERHFSDAFSSTTTDVDVASIDIQFGSDPAENIEITDATPEGIVEAINNADIGVRAYLVDNGASSDSTQIVFESETTGADQDFTITVNTAGSGDTLTFNESQNAQNAQITLDPSGSNPQVIQSASNVFSDVAPGLSITAVKVDTEEISVGLDSNADAIVDKLKELAETFTSIVDVINEQFVLDPTTNRAGPLVGDATLISLKQKLTAAVSQLLGDEDADIRAASQIGFEITRSGQLEFDEEVFRARFASDPDAVVEFFAGPDSFADQLRSVADGFVDVVDGAIVTRINGINRTLSDLSDSITAAEDRLDNVEQSLVQQFTALERTIASLRQQGDFLNQFLLASASR